MTAALMEFQRTNVGLTPRDCVHGERSVAVLAPASAVAGRFGARRQILRKSL